MSIKSKMMEFSASSYNNNVYHFSITPKGEISCIEFGITYQASIIELKPDFVLRNADGSTLYSLNDHLRNRNLKKPNEQPLIMDWNIPEDVLQYLIDNKKIMYSAEMAMLFGYPPEYAYDASQKGKEIRRYYKNRPKSDRRYRKLINGHNTGKFN